MPLLAPVQMRDRLIVALDVPNARDAGQLVRQIGEHAGIYKVGLQLFTTEGPSLVRELVASGRRIFLDLKLHDIPNTVAGAVKSALSLGVSMLTVHASGGTEMLRAASDAAAGKTSVLAVTVLTSLSQASLRDTGVSASLAEQAVRLALLAQGAGCPGVVTSPREVREVRKACGPGFIIVTPGVRPLGSAQEDQERISTPAHAVAAGASHIVVGRPITRAENPAQAAQSVLAEMAEAQPGQ